MCYVGVDGGEIIPIRDGGNIIVRCFKILSKIHYDNVDDVASVPLV